MWSSRELRWVSGLVTVLLVAALLSGCNFRPLYGQNSATGGSTFDELGTVQIVPLTDRTGQQLHNLLRNRLNPRGQPARPNYFLQVTLRESTRNLALRADETATRADLSLIADFTLRESGSDDIVLNGTSRSVNSYNILNSQYATQVSEQDARERGLREVAEEIRAQVAIFLTRKASG